MPPETCSLDCSAPTHSRILGPQHLGSQRLPGIPQSISSFLGAKGQQAWVRDQHSHSCCHHANKAQAKNVVLVTGGCHFGEDLDLQAGVWQNQPCVVDAVLISAGTALRGFGVTMLGLDASIAMALCMLPHAAVASQACGSCLQAWVRERFAKGKPRLGSCHGLL